MLHYNSQHISSSTLFISRRTNCIITASGIVTLCKRPYSMPVESGLQSALNRHDILLNFNIVGYFRYVDDLLIIYRVRHKSINTPLSYERLVGGLQDGGRGNLVTHFVQLYPQPLYTASQVRTTCRSWD